MPYAAGNRIDASDLNSFLNSVRDIYGVGTGDRGYGQTAITQNNIAAGNTILASHWANLRSMIVACANHQGTSTTNLMAAPTAGSAIVFSNTLSTIIGNIDTNRLNAAAGGMTLTSAAHTVTRSGTWTNLTGVVDVVFTSEDAARHFFNQGGELRIRFAHPNGATPNEDEWRTIFNTRVGTITFRAHATTRSGSMGTAASSVGYYEMTGTNQTIYNGTDIGSGAYSTRDVTVSVVRQGFSGVRGANGTTVRFTVNIGGDSTVNATGTQMLVDVFRSNVLSVAVPTYTTVTNF